MAGVPLTIIAIDFIGIIIGVAAIGMAFGLKRRIGGKIGAALTYFIWGIAWMIVAFLYTIFNARLDTAFHGSLHVFGTDIHHALMVIGMVFFILSARAFARVIPSASTRED